MINEVMDENMIDKNINYDYNDDQFNQFEENNEFQSENNIDNIGNEYVNDNQLLLKEKENEILKNKIEELKHLLFQKNKELEETRIKNDNQLIKINKTFDKHINEYQLLVQNYAKIQNELKNAKKEIQNKNNIINNLQNNNNNFNYNNTLEYGKLILLLNQKLKFVCQNFLEEKNNIFNENEYLNNDINSQIQILLKNIDIFYQKLLYYKKSKINEIIQLRNILKNNRNNDNDNYIMQQFYLKFIDLINNFCNNLPNNINDFNNLPNYSIKDSNDKIFNDILITIKILIDYIISYQNENSSNMNNNFNEELNKRLKEMSELLIKSNEYLNKSRQENNDLKRQYNELEKKHNSTIRDISTIDNRDKDYEKLLIELNKKNHQIKSLEHMITRLTNRANKNNTSNIINMTSKSMLNDSSYYGKIINKKLYNEIKNNQNKSSFYLNNNNRFIKDEKNENNLKMFLNKYTNGEYSNKKNENKNMNNKFIINLKDEIENENLNKGIRNVLSDDEIENEQNYNEEEEERKYQMEGKISN